MSNKVQIHSINVQILSEVNYFFIHSAYLTVIECKSNFDIEQKAIKNKRKRKSSQKLIMSVSSKKSK